jgi:hypothetical protein
MATALKSLYNAQQTVLGDLQPLLSVHETEEEVERAVSECLRGGNEEAAPAGDAVCQLLPAECSAEVSAHLSNDVEVCVATLALQVDLCAMLAKQHISL